MKVYINYGVGISRINEEKTEWCCQKFYDWGKTYEDIEDGGNYIGNQPKCIFNWIN